MNCLECGFPLTGQKKKYCCKQCKGKYEYKKIKEKKYKKEWDEKIVEYKSCPVCETRFGVTKSYKNQVCCSKSCGATLRYNPDIAKFKIKKKLSKKDTIIKRKVEYCTPSQGQCELYAKDFSFHNISGGCFGKNWTGNCYQAPKRETLSYR